MALFQRALPCNVFIRDQVGLYDGALHSEFVKILIFAMSENDFICEEMQHELEEEELLGSLSDSPSPSSPKPSTSKGTKRKRVSTAIRCHLCPRYSCKTFESYKRHLKLHAAEGKYQAF